jgi:hypothetical protein
MTVVPRIDLASRDGHAILNGTMLTLVAYTPDRAAGPAVCSRTTSPGNT